MIVRRCITTYIIKSFPIASQIKIFTHLKKKLHQVEAKKLGQNQIFKWWMAFSSMKIVSASDILPTDFFHQSESLATWDYANDWQTSSSIEMLIWWVSDKHCRLEKKRSCSWNCVETVDLMKTKITQWNTNNRDFSSCSYICCAVYKWSSIFIAVHL